MHNYSTAVGHKPTQNTVTGGYILAQDKTDLLQQLFPWAVQADSSCNQAR